MSAMSRNMAGLLALMASTSLGAGTALAHDFEKAPSAAHARFIANEAVLIVDGDDKVLFDPFFHNDEEGDMLAPPAIHDAMMAAAAPFDAVDVIFITHTHGDHFDADDLLTYLGSQPETALVLPAEGMAQLQAADGWQADFAGRITTISLPNGEREALSVGPDDLAVTVLALPHHGWPEYHTDLQHYAYRVETRGGATVIHLGDANAMENPFTPHAAALEAAPSHLAFPPYWFFRSEERQNMLNDIHADEIVGIHIPADVPDAWRNLRETGQIDFFADPDEIRIINLTDSETPE